MVFLLVKKVWTPPEYIYKHLNFSGIINVDTGNGISFKMHNYGFLIENKIFWTGLEGSFEGESLRLWKIAAKMSSCIVDVGSNTGLYALTAKAVNTSSEVYAFEPVNRVFSKLVNNNKINNYNIHCINSALSSMDGNGFMYDSGDDHVYSAVVASSKTVNSNDKDQININLLKLDSFIEKSGICDIDLIKIDVEGHEPEVLIGFERYIEKFKPTIIVEILTDEAGRKVQELVEKYNYLYFDIDENSGAIQKSNITRSSSYNYILCHEKSASNLNLVS